jgi:hypothetical protein
MATVNTLESKKNQKCIWNGPWQCWQVLSTFKLHLKGLCEIFIVSSSPKCQWAHCQQSFKTYWASNHVLHENKYILHTTYLPKITTKEKWVLLLGPSATSGTGGKNPSCNMHKGCGCWPSSHCLTVVLVIISIPLLSSSVVVPISTHNPSYEQWLIGRGVGARCSALSWRWWWGH